MDGLRVVGVSRRSSASEGKRDILSVGLSVKTEKGTYGVSEEPDNADRQQRV